MLPVCLAVGLVVAAVAAAGVFTARQAAQQRLDDQASTAHNFFQQAARDTTRRGAAARTARAFGVGVATPSGRVAVGGGTRTYSYPGVTITVSTRPLADATRHALVLGGGIGAGALLLLVSLTFALFDRRLATPLAALTQTARRVAGGESDARAAEDGPAELREAARSLNALLATIGSQPHADVADPLTGAIAAQHFHEALGIELKRAQREALTVGLVVLDVEDFDDEALKLSARRLRRVMRATDLVARLGDDAFALILPGVETRLALSIAERARTAVSAGSAGVACYPDDARDGSTLIQLANGALDWARRSGSDTSRRYDPKEISLPTDQEERAEIETLLDRDAPLYPVFQPLVSLSTGRVLGYEALSRFPEPPGRAPDSWFSQATRVGLGPRLEALALRAALAREGRPAGTFLSINVSPTALPSPEVQAALPEDMTGLVVEITEQQLADDLDALVLQLEELRGRGARIALDDAGAGYSGLQQVMRVQPDVIKLDRSLVQGVDQDPAKEALIDSFVRFARRTGASVLAEGIETMEELRLLADLDVSYGQGFALARPSEHWSTVVPSVSEALLRRSLRVASKEDMPQSGDQRLEYVSARLSRITSVEELEDVFTLIAQELGAHGICFSRWLRDEHAVETVVDTTPDGGPGQRFGLESYPSTAHVVETGEAVQVLASDPGADLGEVALLGKLGYQSLLMVPVVCRGDRIGLFEAYSTRERPWTRSEINRARIISYQLGSVLEVLSTHA